MIMNEAGLMIEEIWQNLPVKYSGVEIDQYIIMPNHIHLVVYFRVENKLSDYMRDFKKFTSTKIRQLIEETGNKELLKSIRHRDPKRAFKVWQDRFDDVYIGSKNVLETKLDYIHLNPLQEQWGLVTRPEDYEFSSARFYETGVQTGLSVVDYRQFF